MKPTLRQIQDTIESGSLEEFSRLVGDDDALRNDVNDFGSWIHEASANGELPIVKYLVENGADVNLRTDTLEAGPINEAVTEGHLDIAKYLVSQGAVLDVSRPDRNPLFRTISCGYVDIAKWLLEVGIDANVVYRSVTGKLKNALSYAQESGQQGIAELLIAAGCRLPREGVDEPVWEPDETPAEPSANDLAHEQIIAHMREHLGPVDDYSLQEVLPVLSLAINVIRPNDRFPFFTLFTTGMSDIPMTVPEGQEAFQYAELAMHLPATWPLPADITTADEASLWPFLWLRKIAYLPHAEDTWLNGRHTIISSDDPPVPLGPNTAQSCLLLLADFGGWGPVDLDDGRSIKFYTVIPIYTEERDFALEHGFSSLMQRFADSEVTAVLDVQRDNLATV